MRDRGSEPAILPPKTVIVADRLRAYLLVFLRATRSSMEHSVMKLYYWPGACSLSPHIVSREAGIELQLAQLDRAERKTQDGTVLSSVNPKNQVPVLELDNGQRLTEGPVIVQYLADQKPSSGLVPPPGTMERYRVQEWLNFITSELHKTFGPNVPPHHAGRVQKDFAGVSCATL